MIQIHQVSVRQYQVGSVCYPHTSSLVIIHFSSFFQGQRCRASTSPISVVGSCSAKPQACLALLLGVHEMEAWTTTRNREKRLPAFPSSSLRFWGTDQPRIQLVYFWSCDIPISFVSQPNMIQGGISHFISISLPNQTLPNTGTHTPGNDYGLPCIPALYAHTWYFVVNLANVEPANLGVLMNLTPSFALLAYPQAC